jgi:hypothetical protein
MQQQHGLPFTRLLTTDELGRLHLLDSMQVMQLNSVIGNKLSPLILEPPPLP